MIIEIDGESHYENTEYDNNRDQELKKLGFVIIRIGDKRVKNNIEGVICEINDWIDSHE